MKKKIIFFHDATRQTRAACKILALEATLKSFLFIAKLKANYVLMRKFKLHPLMHNVLKWSDTLKTFQHLLQDF